MGMTEKIDILLVEDNQYDAELSMRALQKLPQGNRVVWVQDGAEALDFLFGKGVYAGRQCKDPPRLILLDIKMPRVGGIDVLRQIKADQLLRSIPVVMLTSSAEAQDLSECYELGVNSYIVKPVHFEKFQEEVEKAGWYWMLLNRVPRA